jgi:hypothetical protein
LLQARSEYEVNVENSADAILFMEPRQKYKSFKYVIIIKGFAETDSRGADLMSRYPG